MADDDHERRSELRHFVRNRLAAIRNAAFYLQRRTEPTALWHDDPRVSQFFALIVHELGQIEEAMSGGGAPAVAPQPARAQPSTAVRVLVVDDHDGNRETLAALLADEGFAVESIPTFMGALAALESNAVFDVVLLDRHLGEYDGLDLVPLVRASRPRAKVIVVSGACNEPIEGVDDVVRKDLGFEVLHRRMLGLLGTT